MVNHAFTLSGSLLICLSGIFYLVIYTNFFCSGCVGLFCPCYLFGKNAESLGSGTLIGSCVMHFILWALVNTVCCVLTDGIMICVPGCFVACYACGYRRTLRENYNLEVYLHFISLFMHISFHFHSFRLFQGYSFSRKKPILSSLGCLFWNCDAFLRPPLYHDL